MVVVTKTNQYVLNIICMTNYVKVNNRIYFLSEYPYLVYTILGYKIYKNKIDIKNILKKQIKFI